MRKWRYLFLLLLVNLLSISCSSTNNSIVIPPEEKFTIPAVGTLIPVGGGTHQLSIPHDVGGSLVVNNTEAEIRVVVSDTIATIKPTQGFLFILPPGTYQYYIYGLGTSKIYVDQVQGNKVRYVYISSPK